MSSSILTKEDSRECIKIFHKNLPQLDIIIKTLLNSKLHKTRLSNTVIKIKGIKKNTRNFFYNHSNPI